MIRAYTEIVNFIATGATPAMVASFHVSDETRDYVAALIRREKTDGLTGEESSELDNFLAIEHVMRMAKAKAQSLLSQ